MKIPKFIFTSLLLIFIMGCNLYPDDDARIDEFDAVITYYDRTAKFGNYKTFVMIDSVTQIAPNDNGNSEGGSSATANSEYILSLIRVNMQSRGYTEVANPNDADLVINAGVLLVNNLVITSSYPGYYWDCGLGWCNPGYWWGYPGYDYYYPWVPVAFVSEYEVGTLLIDIIDNKNFDPNTSPGLLIKWASVIRGVTNLTGQADVLNRLRIDINLAFEQSPYLKSNQ